MPSYTFLKTLDYIIAVADNIDSADMDVSYSARALAAAARAYIDAETDVAIRENEREKVTAVIAT